MACTAYFWTAERVAELRALAVDHTASEIAREMGITSRAAMQQCYLLDIRLHCRFPRTAEQREHCRQAAIGRIARMKEKKEHDAEELAALTTARIDRMMQLTESIAAKKRFLERAA